MKGSSKHTGLGIALGASLGAVAGLVAGHVGVWLAIGVAIGLAIGVSMRPKVVTDCPECVALHRVHERKNLEAAGTRN